MKKKIALLLLLVGLVAQAKSFRSSSSSSRSFSRPSSSSSRSFSSSSSRSSSSSSFKSSSSSSSKSFSKPIVKPKVTTVRPTTSVKSTNKTNNNTTIINNNKVEIERGGIDVMDVILLNAVMNNNNGSTHTKETVYVEKPVVEEKKQVVEEKKEVKIEQEEESNGVKFIKVLGMIAMAGIAIILMAGLFL